MSIDPPIRILYDGNCPLCCRQVAFLKRRDPKEKLRFSDIRSTLNLPLPIEPLEKQIHAVMPDGSIVARMDVIRAAYREVGLGWIVAPTGWLILRPCFNALYGMVAKHRLTISRWWRC